MEKFNQKLESTHDILKDLGIVAPWIESRGPKFKYKFFHTMQPGEILEMPVSLRKARAIQTGIKNAANKQGFKIKTQNKGSYIRILLVK